MIGFRVVISRNRSTQFSSFVDKPHLFKADLNSLRVQPGGALAASFFPRNCLVNVDIVHLFLRACSRTAQAPAPCATRLRALAPTSSLSVNTRQTSSTWQSVSSQPAKARMASACKDAASFAGSPAACRAGCELMRDSISVALVTLPVTSGSKARHHSSRSTCKENQWLMCFYQPVHGVIWICRILSAFQHLSQ